MNKDYENWVKEMFEKYKSIIFLERYQVYFKYINKESQYLASRCHYPYLNFTLEYGDRAIKRWEEDKLEAERDIIHEFSHLLTDPLYYVATKRYATSDEIESARERLTDHISKIISKNISKI